MVCAFVSGVAIVVQHGPLTIVGIVDCTLIPAQERDRLS